MPKDNRTIVNAIRFEGETYGPGREDELEELMDKKTIDRLIKDGSLAGDWGTAESKKAATADAKEEAADLKVIEKNLKTADKTESFDVGALEEMNRDALIEYASKHDVTTSDSMTTDEIINAIKDKMSIPT